MMSDFTKRSNRVWELYLAELYEWGCYNRHQHVLRKPVKPMPAKNYAAAVRASYAAFQGYD